MGRPNIRNKYRKPYRKDIDMEDKNKNPEELPEDAVDRKSTRLNSSHMA